MQNKHATKIIWPIKIFWQLFRTDDKRDIRHILDLNDIFRVTHKKYEVRPDRDGPCGVGKVHLLLDAGGARTGAGCPILCSQF